MKNIVTIKGLKKKYAGFALDIENVTIPEGMIVGLIGENGAGKTTLIKAILNIIKKDEGTITVFNQEYKQAETAIKEEIGIVMDDMFFPEILTVSDIDTIMKGIFQKWDSTLFFQYVKDFDIPSNKKINALSKGMKKKLEIATALAHKPKLLILDEPTSGLDPVVRSEVLDIFLDFIKDESHSVLLSTHITSDLEHIADRILFIDNGRIVLDQSRDELIDGYGIMKCDAKDFERIDKEDIVAYKKNKYDVQILVADRDQMSRKYQGCTIDKMTLEDLMVLMIKGEK